MFLSSLLTVDGIIGTQCPSTYMTSSIENGWEPSAISPLLCRLRLMSNQLRKIFWLRLLLLLELSSDAFREDFFFCSFIRQTVALALAFVPVPNVRLAWQEVKAIDPDLPRVDEFNLLWGNMARGQFFPPLMESLRNWFQLSKNQQS